MKSNKCPYLKKECERPYNSDKCLNNYEKCWEYGRQTYIKNYKAFEETPLMDDTILEGRV
jgi:hypothetical protein